MPALRKGWRLPSAAAEDRNTYVGCKLEDWTLTRRLPFAAAGDRNEADTLITNHGTKVATVVRWPKTATNS